MFLPISLYKHSEDYSPVFLLYFVIFFKCCSEDHMQIKHAMQIKHNNNAVLIM